jgi:NAD(P)-dependent dehydrogenase (short-subunit alcohol dehydrogenase family)
MATEQDQPTHSPAEASLDRAIFHEKCLEGRTALVTGASSGLGRAAAIALSKVGARIIVTGRDQERLDATLEMLSGDGHAAIASDLSNADQAADLVKGAAQAHGPLDGIFHSAGIFSVLPAKMTKQRHIDEIFNASVPGAYGVARAVSQRNVMRDGGSIVFMSSVAGVRGNAGLTAYAGAKAAILGLNQALAVELAARRIRVNAIVAGTVATEMHLRMQASTTSEQGDANANKHLLGYGAPADVANAVLFLLSDAARWITGTSLTVDGGYLA